MTAQIAVVGTGYVGLTTGAYLAHLGHSVVCADVVPEKIERLSQGDVPIHEAGLDELVREGIDGGRLRFVLGAAAAVEGAEFVFLCLPTPQGEDGSADMSYVEGVAEEIGPLLEPESIVINKSTVPVGSNRRVAQLLGRDDVYVVSNPEFLREGTAVHDSLHPDRIVVGCDDQAAAVRVGSLFEHLQAPLIITDPATAETIKYASNAFLATKVSFINAVAHFCELAGADVRDVVLGMGYDKRIGFEFLRPGPGFGGSCFAGDETLIIRRAGKTQLTSFRALWQDRDRAVAGTDVLSWRDGELSPEFLPLQAVTARVFVEDLVEVRTKMGRRVCVTPDHPFIVGDGRVGAVGIKLASELSENDWLPVAQGFPFESEPNGVPPILSTITAAGLDEDAVIVRLGKSQRAQLSDAIEAGRVPAPRRYDVKRSSVARLSELRSWGVDQLGGAYGTAKNGTYVPAAIEPDGQFWRIVGLFLAEGHITRDGDRVRITWSFHPRNEEHLVREVAGFWETEGVKTSINTTPTSRTVSISSRLLSAWFLDGLGLGATCYDHRVPDAIWGQPEHHKWQLLAGYWEGDGSWSLVNGGPSAIIEAGTASRQLADGLLRLLGDLGIVASLRVGRTAKSTVDTYWIRISGAEQVDDARWLFAEEERRTIFASTNRQAKRIAPTGYRPLSKNAAWVRVVGRAPAPSDGTVYSVEVADAHTVVTTGGLVAHNCFPKDAKALMRMAESYDYDFGFLRAVIEVNERQYDLMADKIEQMAGGDLRGRVVAALGLAFKARTDDTRESPAIHVIERLLARGARVQAFDPVATTDREAIEVCGDAYAACAGADVAVVLTEWDDFRWLDFDKVRDVMAEARIVDARNLLDPAALRRKGFTYEGVGRL